VKFSLRRRRGFNRKIFMGDSFTRRSERGGGGDGGRERGGEGRRRKRRRSSLIIACKSDQKERPKEARTYPVG